MAENIITNFVITNITTKFVITDITTNMIENMTKKKMLKFFPNFSTPILNILLWCTTRPFLQADVCFISCLCMSHVLSMYVSCLVFKCSVFSLFVLCFAYICPISFPCCLFQTQEYLLIQSIPRAASDISDDICTNTKNRQWDLENTLTYNNSHKRCLRTELLL